MLRNLILYGGTFDPIHYGHINTAKSVQNYFHFDQFLFVPCKRPILKNKPVATPEQRIAMLKLALEDEDSFNFSIDLVEIKQDYSMYTVDTLEHFRQQLGKTLPITLLMGRDNFLQLPLWHNWKELFKLANLLIIERAGVNSQAYPENLQPILQAYQVENPSSLLQISHGQLSFFNAGYFDISSTAIRNKIAKGIELSAHIPEKVLKFIRLHGLYENPNEGFG